VRRTLPCVNGLVGQLASVVSHGRGEISNSELNFMLSLVKGVKPRDQIEAMLAIQMAAVHMASMKYARRLETYEFINQMDHAERTLNKLMRTFTTQMEALKRYRTGGEQKVTVQHVSVSEGGQVIVGNVTQAPKEKTKDTAEPPALTYSPGVEMPVPSESKERERVRRGTRK